MCKFWNRLNGEKYQSSAKVVDGNLIISLPDAINPIVWRMELGNVKASAMEVRANDNNHLLILKTPKGETHEIAPFEDKSSAVNALMRISHALEKAEGQMNAPMAYEPTSALTAPHTKARKWDLKKLFTVLAILLLVYFVYVLASSAPVATQQSTSSLSSGNAAESGVPQSADEYLRGF